MTLFPKVLTISENDNFVSEKIDFYLKIIWIFLKTLI